MDNKTIFPNPLSDEAADIMAASDVKANRTAGEKSAAAQQHFQKRKEQADEGEAAVQDAIEFLPVLGILRVIRTTVQPNSKFPVTSFLFSMHALCAMLRSTGGNNTD